MEPPDAVAAFEHEHLPMRGRFSSALDWPTLQELFPTVSSSELDRLRRRVHQLNAVAQTHAHAVRHNSTMTEKTALADLRISFPEFSESTLRQAFDDGRWYALW